MARNPVTLLALIASILLCAGAKATLAQTIDDRAVARRFIGCGVSYTAYILMMDVARQHAVPSDVDEAQAWAKKWEESKAEFLKDIQMFGKAALRLAPKSEVDQMIRESESTVHLLTNEKNSERSKILWDEYLRRLKCEEAMRRARSILGQP